MGPSEQVCVQKTEREIMQANDKWVLYVVRAPTQRQGSMSQS